MNLKFKGKRISGILSVLPKNEVRFENEMSNYSFSTAKSLKLKAVMGYNTRRVVEQGVCVSDLCIAGLNYLFEKSFLKKEEIDALILVTQSPDHFMPATSSIIHGKLQLKQDIICMDINQGCAGFIIGLFESFLLLEQEAINKVVLLNADVLSRKVSKRDRNSNPLIGDGASVTVIEKDKNRGSEIFANIKMDGTGADALFIPAGGFRLPSNEKTAEMVEDASGNVRSSDNLVMKGDEVFNFVQSKVPVMIEDLIKFADTSLNTIDYFMFHQPNKFMLQKLADKLGVPYEKMPNHVVEKFGNSSGVTIPVAITSTLNGKLLNGQYKMCLAGFGVGLTWGSILLSMNNFSFCETIEF